MPMLVRTKSAGVGAWRHACRGARGIAERGASRLRRSRQWRSGRALLSKVGPGWASLGGLRPALAKGGIAVGGTYYGEAFVNSGGFNQGGKYDGVLDVPSTPTCTSSASGKASASTPTATRSTATASPPTNIGSLMPVSNLEATNATRLFELWFEQHMFNDKLAVKVGQLAADTEFIICPTAAASSSTALGAGRRSRPPICRAAVRPIRWRRPAFASPSRRTTISQLLVGVYNGDPARP